MFKSSLLCLFHSGYELFTIAFYFNGFNCMVEILDFIHFLIWSIEVKEQKQKVHFNQEPGLRATSVDR